MVHLRTTMLAAGFLGMLGSTTNGQSVAFFPNVASFPSGVSLSATPVVSADRRYVRLGMVPQFTAIEGFDTYSVPAAVSGGGNVGAGVGLAGLNGPMNGPGAPFPNSPQEMPGMGIGFGGANGEGSSDFEDRPWPAAGEPRRQTVAAGRPLPNASKPRRGRGVRAPKRGAGGSRGRGMAAARRAEEPDVQIKAAAGSAATAP